MHLSDTDMKKQEHKKANNCKALRNTWTRHAAQSLCNQWVTLWTRKWTAVNKKMDKWCNSLQPWLSRKCSHNKDVNFTPWRSWTLKLRSVLPLQQADQKKSANPLKALSTRTMFAMQVLDLHSTDSWVRLCQCQHYTSPQARAMRQAAISICQTMHWGLQLRYLYP